MAGYKVSKSSGSHSCSGTTRKIREQLNFNDEKKWKKFSNRRLELIDKFGLSERKASEQDDNIRQIATILRTEFGYSLSAAGEFEKLVTAAVQSVRRNRKRSKKRLPDNSSGTATTTNTGSSEDEFMAKDDSPLQRQISMTPIAPDLHSNMQSLNFPATSLPSIQPKSIQPSSRVQTTTPAPSAPGPTAGSPAVPEASGAPVAAASSVPSGSALAGTSHPSYHMPPQQRYADVIKAVIADVVNNVVTLTDQSQKDRSSSTNLTEFAMSINDNHLLSFGLHNKPSITGQNQSKSSASDIPFFLREKLLVIIQRSRTCFDMAHSQGSIDLHSNLEILGEMAVRSSIAFVIERFFSNLMPSSMEYLTSKTSSLESLASLSINVFGPASKRSLSHLPPAVQTKLLFLVIGGLIKDFGFDPCLYPLSEIVHHLVMHQYPSVTKSSVLAQKNGTNSDASQRITVLSSLSMKPQLANEDVNKKVVIKFKGREQAFTFHLLSNGPPTVNEILENCKSLFQIISQTKQLSLCHNNSIVRDDVELAKLFNSFSNQNIVLEVKEAQRDPSDLNDGLKILSDASLQIKQEIPNGQSHKNSTSSLDAFDKIISRIGKFPKNADASLQQSFPPSNMPASTSHQANKEELPSLPSVVMNGARNNFFFQDNNLPQSVFQPLL